MILPDPISLHVLHALQSIRTDALASFCDAVSRAGEGIWLLLLSTLVFWLFGPRRGWRVAFALILADLLVGVVKNLLQVPRPWIADPSLSPYWPCIASAFGFSFPSGHVANSAALAFALAAEAPRARPAAWSLALLWTALMAFSRMTLGFHTPADVLAAALLAAFSVWTVHRVFSAVDSRPRRIPLALLGALLLAALSALAVAFAPRPDPAPAFFGEDAYRCVACLFGMVLALLLERRLVRHDPAGYAPLWRLVSLAIALVALHLSATTLPYALRPLCASPFQASAVSAFFNPLLSFAILPALLKPLRRSLP